MITEEHIYNTLSGLAGGRVFPMVISGNTYPAITYQRVGGTPVTSLSGLNSLDHGRFQIDCYAETYLSAKQLANQVKQLAPVNWVLALELDGVDADTQMYRVTLDYMVHFAI